MMRSYKRRMYRGLMLVGLAMLVGCEQTQPAKNPPAVSPDPHAPATAEDVQRETSEAAQATREYLSEKKDEFAAETQQKLEQLDTKMAEMKVKGDELKGEAKVKWDAAMEDLKLKRAEMSVKLEELKKSSGTAWEDLKAGLEKADNDIDAAAEDAVQRFKETPPEDSPDNSTNPQSTNP